MCASSSFFTRQYTPSDRDAIRRICVETAWCGQPAPKRIGDPWIWAEFWTRYFTDRLPYYSWVVEEKGTYDVVGYLQGTHNAALTNRYLAFLLPALIQRWCGLVSEWGLPAGQPLVRLARSCLRGEMKLPPGIIERYPATFHLNLMPEARGLGMASKLFARFLEQMRSRRVPGIHVQTLTVNEAASKFLTRHGFERIHECSLTAFDDVEVAIHTWIGELSTGHAADSDDL